jgi:hypothetical protein
MMTKTRKKRGVAFWASVVVVAGLILVLVGWAASGLIGDLLYEHLKRSGFHG